MTNREAEELAGLHLLNDALTLCISVSAAPFRAAPKKRRDHRWKIKMKIAALAVEVQKEIYDLEALVGERPTGNGAASTCVST